MLWTSERVREKLRTDQRFLEEAILFLQSEQTSAERNTRTTREWNGRGWSSFDAAYGDYLAAWIKRGNNVSGQHLDRARKMLVKYSEQIAREWNRREGGKNTRSDSRETQRDNARRMRLPSGRFANFCSSCDYLGQDSRFDYYFCQEDHRSVVRFGNEIVDSDGFFPGECKGEEEPEWLAHWWVLYARTTYMQGFAQFAYARMQREEEERKVREAAEAAERKRRQEEEEKRRQEEEARRAEETRRWQEEARRREEEMRKRMEEERKRNACDCCLWIGTHLDWQYRICFKRDAAVRTHVTGKVETEDLSNVTHLRCIWWYTFDGYYERNRDKYNRLLALYKRKESEKGKPEGNTAAATFQKLYEKVCHVA